MYTYGWAFSLRGKGVLVSLVLNTGVYPPLLETRRLLLEEAGHTVVTATEEETVMACRRHHFEVAVIGQSASPQLKRRIFALIRRQCPSAKILELVSADAGPSLEGADSWLELHHKPSDALARRVAELVHGGRGKVPDC